MMKKHLSLCLALGIMLISAVSLPAQSSDKKPVSLTWLTMVGGETYNFTEGVLHNDVFDELAKRTGVTMDFTPAIGANDYNARVGLLLASGNVPDIIMARDGVSLDKILKSGIALDIEDLVKKYGPNIMKYGKKALAVMKLQRSNGTGKLYGIPEGISLGSDLDQNYPQGFYVRWDLYKKLGKPAIKNEDDYLKVVADMLKLEPKNKDGKKNYGFGFDLKWPGAHMQLGDYPFTALGGIYFATWENSVDIRNESVFVPRITENNLFAREMLFWNKAVRMGLVDPESISQDTAGRDSKAKEGRYLAQAGWVSSIMQQAEQTFIDDGTPEKGFAQVIVESLTSKDKMVMANLPTAGGSTTTIITKACKDPIRAIQYLDYLMSPEGAVLQYYGIEGKHWDLKDGKGVIRPEVINNFKSDPDYWMKTGINFYNPSRFQMLNFLRPYGQTFRNGIDTGFDQSPEFIAQNLNAVQKDYTKAYGVKIPAEVLTKRAPVIAWDPWACNIMVLPDELAVKENKISAYMDTAIPKLVFTAKTDAEFTAGLKKMLAEMKAMGWDECSAYHAKDYANVNTEFAKMLASLNK